MKKIQIEGIDADEFFNKLGDILKSTSHHREIESSTKNYIWLTRQETANLLKISTRSLHNWTTRGVLKSYSLGNRVYYRSDEVEKSLHPNKY